MGRYIFSAQGWPYLLTPFILVAVVCDYVLDASPSVTFFAAALGIIPTAALMSLATEELAARSGPGIGGLLNVTFGNAPELIIAALLLGKGLQEVVKASLVGSILGNLLLVLGASMLVGGLGREKQAFSRTAVTAQGTMLLVGVAGFVLVAVFAVSNGIALPAVGDARTDFGSDLEHLSVAISVILGITYVAGLFFSLKTHRDFFNPASYEDDGEETLGWSVRRSVFMLALAGAFVGLVSEILVGSVEDASHAVGISEFFVGAIIVAIVGNAAEHWVAVVVARKDKMDLALNIAVGSAAQIALFVTPVLVLLSLVVGPYPMPLMLNGYEIAGLVFAVLTANYVTQDGESTWFNGVQLLAVYVILGLVFAFA